MLEHHETAGLSSDDADLTRIRTARLVNIEGIYRQSMGCHVTSAHPAQDYLQQ